MNHVHECEAGICEASLMSMRPSQLLLLFLLIAAGCSDGDVIDEQPATTTTRATGAGSTPAETAPRSSPGTGEIGAAHWAPSIDDTWQWQLEGEINTTHDADVFDIDLFDAPTETMGELKARGIKTVCYFSAGSWEEWRSDADDFPTAAIGETLDGWEDERWLDITDEIVFEVMERRLDLAADRGCDAVEPDNVAGYDDETGFDFGRDDQASYNRALAEAAHARGLAIGLKNALELIEELEPQFDFAVNEQCWEYDECDVLQPFIDAGKPVFNAEYTDRFVERPDEVCAQAVAFGMRTLILPLDLDDGFRISCDDR